MFEKVPDKAPDAATMRSELYEMEKKGIENKIAQINQHLDELLRQENQREVADNSINGEVNLLNATKEELEKRLVRLQTQYEHGR